MTATRRSRWRDQGATMRLRDSHPNIRLRIVVGFVQRFLAIMLTPLMVIHLASRYGPAVTGVLMTVVACAGIVAPLVGGHLADTWGRRPVLLLGEGAAAVLFAALAAVNKPPSDSAFLTYLFYLALVFLTAMAIPAADAVMVDVSTPESRQAMYAFNYWSINVAFTLGALVGPFFYGEHFFGLLVAGAVLSTLTLLVIFRWIVETKPTPDLPSVTGIAAVLRGYLSLSTDRGFLRQLLAAVLIASIELQIVYYIAVRLAGEFGSQHLVELGSWSPTVDGIQMLGILRATNAALVVVLTLGVALVARHASHREQLVGGLLAFIGGYMVWAVSNVGWVLLLAALVLTMGEVVSVPVRQSLLANSVPAHARTRYLAVYGLNFRVGLLVAGICVTLGAVAPAGVMAGLYAALGALAVWLYVPLLPRRAVGRHRRPSPIPLTTGVVT